MPILPDLGRDAGSADVEVAAWAASGAMAITGRADGPALGPPAGLVTTLGSLGERLRQAAAAVGGRIAVDPLALLGERAAIAGLGRHGPVSCGGATRLLPCRDGWIAVSLARPDDVTLVPAWLQRAGASGDPWATIAGAVAPRPGAEVVDRARWLGLPAAWLPAPADATFDRSPRVEARVLAPGAPVHDITGVTVIELSALWAGPLCGSLLAACGADVVKVESTARPDGARAGPAAFFDLLNAGKRSVALDLRSREGVEALQALVAAADIVIEASRPRALEQLGIDAPDLVAAGGPRAWVAITGHGREGPARDWVAFGDDAAVAGGLVAWDEDGPVFCADAIADPVTGVVAAVATLEALVAGGHHLLDVPLAAVAAHLAGPTRSVPPSLEPALPGARTAPGAGPGLGEHTAVVLAELRANRSRR